MSYQALARKWRPRSFSELVGQSAVRTALENALGQAQLHPALLFSGTRGVGKTTLGRIVARSLNCEQGVSATPCGECSACVEIDQGRFIDLIEVDAASRTRIDETRELLDNVQYAPTRGRYKVYLIDEVHMLSRHSFNALLKTLEEPPPHVQFLLATTDPQKLPVTILSRCLQFHLKRIALGEIDARLRFILDAEGIKYDDDGVARLARGADGSLRDALSLLDQAIAHGAGSIDGASVAGMLGSIERRELLGVLEALAANEPDAAWAAVEHIHERGLDFNEALDDLGRLIQRLALLQFLPEHLETAEADELAELAGGFAPEDLQIYYQIIVHARRDLGWAPDPRTGFEMCLIRLFSFLPDDGQAARPAPHDRSAHKARSAGSAARSAAPEASAGASADGSGRSAAAARRAPLQKPCGDWSEMIEALDLRGPSLQLARHCVMESGDETTVSLCLDEAGQAMRTEMAEGKLRAAIKARFGAELSISLAAVDVAAPVDTPARVETQAVEDRARHARDAFHNDPSVQQFAAEFGAEVVEDSIRPREPGS